MNNSIISKAVITTASIVGPLFAAWLYLDQYFAKAEDISQIERIMLLDRYQSEKSMLLLRMDIIEERIDKEMAKELPNTVQISRWQNQQNRMHNRYREVDRSILDIETIPTRLNMRESQ